MSTSDIEKLIQDSGGYLEAFQALVAEKVNEEVSKASRSTVADRKYKHLETILSKDKVALTEMKSQMSTFITMISTSTGLELPAKEVLDEDQSYDLLNTYLAYQKIVEFAETWKSQLREIVFSHITEERRREGLPNPDNINGEIIVEEVGKRFVKEGAGRKPATVNQEKIRQLLSDEDYQEVLDVEIIPQRSVTKLSYEKLMKKVQEKPELMEALRESIVLGEFKSPSFIVRDLKK